VPKFELRETRENAKYIRIADLLVLPNTNRSEKHYVRKAVVYVCVCVYVCIYIYIYFIYCVEGLERERY
jgi:hypothetical protein